jgi:hypothetical protein
MESYYSQVNINQNQSRPPFTGRGFGEEEAEGVLVPVGVFR